jgi:hypothetical protein
MGQARASTKNLQQIALEAANSQHQEERSTLKSLLETMEAQQHQK